jgi:1-carboxybiuret hydrolase subunit AtzH-like protein
MELDRPETVAAARALLDHYERALMANQTEALDEIFWADPRTVRFGITENLFGHEAIRAFRASIRAYAPRVQKRVELTAFGEDMAVTNLVYERVGTGLIGRETKIMARLPAGWRVVSAHVSLLAEADSGTKRG